MKKALIYETFQEKKKMFLTEKFTRNDATTQKTYYSDGYLPDGTILLYEKDVTLK